MFEDEGVRYFECDISDVEQSDCVWIWVSGCCWECILQVCEIYC